MQKILVAIFLSTLVLTGSAGGAGTPDVAEGASATKALQYELLGRAVLKADTFREGPTSAREISSQNGVTTPFLHRQPIQGFSDLAIHPEGGFWALSDNGYGTRENSPDFVLVLYRLRPDFASGVITVTDVIELSDPRHHAGFPLVADREFYPGTRDSVDSRIRAGRLLTGADFDPEGLVAMPDGSFWLGDEFGPFLLHFDAQGELLSAPLATPGVRAPENPLLKGRVANHPSSGGFEGLCASPDHRTIYGLLEKAAANDDPQTLRLYRFDPAGKEFVGDPPYWHYPLHGSGTHYIGAVATIDSTTLAVLERDSEEGAAARFKKIYLVDLDRERDGVLNTRELADLLEIPDPMGLAAGVEGERKQGSFAMPFVTIEGLVKLDEHTLAVCNDNNFPMSVGRYEREGLPDDNEIVLLRFDRPLAASR